MRLIGARVTLLDIVDLFATITYTELDVEQVAELLAAD